MSTAITLFDSLAASSGLSTETFLSTIKATVFPNKGNGCTNEQLAAFLMVAKQYNLNPLTKEIFAFPANGGIQPVVSVDGWMKLINSHPDFDGMTFADTLDGDKVVSITCKIHRKDRSNPIEATEYMAECKRDTQVWKQWPRRMLRHKAAIQAARYAFGFAGIYDPDEAERIEAPANTDQAKVDEYLAEIAAAESVKALNDIGGKLSVDKLTVAGKQKCREAWTARKNVLTPVVEAVIVDDSEVSA